jgi:hypothetical protein
MPRPLNPRLNLPKGIRDIVGAPPSSTGGGGTILLTSPPQPIDGPGLTGNLPITRLSTADMNPADVIAPDGAGGVTARAEVGGHTHHWNEPPAGVVDGLNGVFTLAVAPSPSSSLMLFRNGLLMLVGAGHDFTLAGGTITFQAGNEPAAGAVLVASYTA